MELVQFRIARVLGIRRARGNACGDRHDAERYDDSIIRLRMVFLSSGDLSARVRRGLGL
jgi:hypothetical protein